MTDPLVYIIVLNWNGLEHLKVCFDSLARLDYPNYRVVMVDNGSGDGSQEFVRENYPGVEILQNRRNIGFARGNNRGMRYALDKGAEYICLLNNDMEVDRSWVKELVAKAETDPAIGACASKMLFFFNRCFINGIGTCMNRIATGWDQHTGRLDTRALAVEEECLGVCAGACCLRGEALRKAGLLDPNYFIYYEDTDLCVRLWKNGYRVVTAPGAIVYHKYSATMKVESPWKWRIALKSKMYFICKLYPWQELLTALPKMLYREARSILNLVIRKRRCRHALAKVSGIAALAVIIPRSILYRIRNGTAFTARSWAFIKDENLPRMAMEVHLPAPTQTEGLPDSTISMNYHDNRLVSGWYARLNDADFIWQWTSKEAVAILKKQRAGQHVLMLDMSNPYHNVEEVRVRIQVNGMDLGSCGPDKSWRIYRFPCEVESGELKIQILADRTMPPQLTGDHADYAVRVKMISISPQGESAGIQ